MKTTLIMVKMWVNGLRFHSFQPNHQSKFIQNVNQNVNQNGPSVLAFPFLSMQLTHKQTSTP